MHAPARELRAIVRKMHAWELLHLRRHAADLQGQIERLQAENSELRCDLSWAEDASDVWRAAAEQAQEYGARLGVTRAGDVVVMGAAS